MTNKIKESNITDGAVTSAKLDANAVTSAKLNYPLTTFSSTGIDDNATSTAITIDSGENVGIGTSSPANKLHVLRASSGSVYGADGADLFIIENNDSLRIDLKTTSTNTVGIMFSDDVRNQASLQYSHSSDSMSFRTNNGTRMTIDSSGRVGISNTSPNYNLEIGESDGVSNRGLSFNLNNNVGQIRTRSNLSDTQTHYEIINSNGTVGTIKSVGSSSSFNTSSDYRLKENVSYDFDATTRLKQLKPARFNFIADADTTVDGFLAHEVSSVIPEAISGTKDETETKEKVVVNANGNVIAENIEQTDWEAGKIADENGNTQYPIDSTWEATKVVPVYQGIDQSKLVPILTKALQEAITKIETLEARITALETT